jgi:hypothetical protein
VWVALAIGLVGQCTSPANRHRNAACTQHSSLITLITPSNPLRPHFSNGDQTLTLTWLERRRRYACFHAAIYLLRDGG